MPPLDELAILNRLTQLKLDGLIIKLPSAGDFPPTLRYLTLANTCLGVDPMPVLEKISKLFFLKLRNAFTGEQMLVSEFGFAKLRVLCIAELWNLRNLHVGDGAMRKLLRVEINNCPYLKNLPNEIALKANLEKLKMV
ncbi:disease resistance protein RPH8A-like [Salvia splendens]|nr:disease resistance protein RPH8A-like [Salvia splendens]